MQSRICGSRRRLRRRFPYHYTIFRPRRVVADERPPPLRYAEAPSRFSAVGLPGGPNIRIRLLGDRPERRAGFSKPIVALMQERSARVASSRNVCVASTGKAC
jgi:hypothetical protein